MSYRHRTYLGGVGGVGVDGQESGRAKRGQQPPGRRLEGTYLSLSRSPDPEPRAESSAGPSRSDHLPGRQGWGGVVCVCVPAQLEQRAAQ